MIFRGRQPQPPWTYRHIKFHISRGDLVPDSVNQNKKKKRKITSLASLSTSLPNPSTVEMLRRRRHASPAAPGGPPVTAPAARLVSASVNHFARQLNVSALVNKNRLPRLMPASQGFSKGRGKYFFFSSVRSKFQRGIYFARQSRIV